MDSGVVFRTSPSWVQIALNQPNTSADWGKSTYTLLQLANNVTYKRMDRAISNLTKNASSPVVQVLFGEKEPDPYCKPVEIVPFNQGLNASQVEAISFTLGRTDVGLVHGPPGTNPPHHFVNCHRNGKDDYDC